MKGHSLTCRMTSQLYVVVLGMVEWTITSVSFDPVVTMGLLGLGIGWLLQCLAAKRGALASA